VVGRSDPDVIYFLAGVSAVAERGHIAPVAAVALGGAMNVIASALDQAKPARIVLVGSSHMYGMRDLRNPVRETAPLRPTTVYGALKAAAEAAAIGIGKATGLEVVAARPFNHIGPGQQPSFAAAALAQQVRTIRVSGGRGTVRVGSLDVRRDFTDVRDVVRAYRLLATEGTAGEAYNIASETSVSIRDVLHGLLSAAAVEADVVVDKGLIRTWEPGEIVGSAEKIRTATGWRPSIPLKKTLQDLIDDRPPPQLPRLADSGSVNRPS
jgi:GDP-4-dehydro-6-deoxy-D-mannose reductase